MARFNKNKLVHDVAKGGSNMQYRFFNNRVVEAKLSGAEVKFAFHNFVDDILSDANFFKPNYGNASHLADTYYGRAYCNVDMGEVFDKEVGKKIASSRCTSLFRGDFDTKIVMFLEELHRVEAKLFNRLRKKGKLNLYFKARGVDELYNDSFRMPGQDDFFTVVNSMKEPVHVEE